KVRLGREDWVELGLSLLAKHGPEALTIERLTDAAKKTRGSFYHHFEDHQAFLAAIGAHWFEREIEGKIADIDMRAVGGKRREAVERDAAGIDHALERELRRLAANEPSIADLVT